ncbi:aminotransferase class V-fold PLP-dependent enzyme [Streptomyces sp. NPDC005438]|uniref:pyridoxal phosphate-dependent decarboxylase family protein n=1 Tax=Streptomyces sp. NPDC005438 TaxID=3156880 RepID=UPI0033B3DAA1
MSIPSAEDPPPPTALAGGTRGPEALRPLTATAIDALADGARRRGGPLPAGGPDAVAARVREVLGPVIPEQGRGATEALRSLVSLVAEGAADPADPHCVAHLHCPPLASAAVADLAASALNPSMDSWDQAPASGALEAEVCAALARLVYPDHPAPDALVTSGGTESNLVGLLLAREWARGLGTAPLRVLCGANAHHSAHRAAWTLGLPAPETVPCPGGTLDPEALRRLLADSDRPTLVVATAGTTDQGLIDPLERIAEVASAHGARLHVDAAYGGPLLFHPELATRLRGLTAAATVSLDLHKLGWQPVAAGVLAVAESGMLAGLAHHTDYLNAEDDTESGLPDLLGRSIRTSRRPDVLKIAVTLRSLGRAGLAETVADCVRLAEDFAARLDADPALRRCPGPVGLSTVLFRPALADRLPPEEGDALVAEVRRQLLWEGRAVLGRAKVPDGVSEGASEGGGRLWLKATLLHPHTRPEQLEDLLKLVVESAQLAYEPGDGR